MNKFKLLVLIFCSNLIFGAGFNSLSSTSNNETKISFSQGQISTTIIGEYIRVSSGRSGTTTDYGMPELPIYSTLVQIKPEKEYEVSFNVLQSHIVSDVNIYPFQDKDRKEVNGVIHFVNESFYSHGNVYPASILNTSERLVMRDLHALSIQITPFRFSPLLNELEVIESVEISIIETGDNSESGASSSLTSRSFEPLYSNLVVNYETQSRNEDYQMPAVLYICGGNSQTNNAFQQLVNWRHKRGYVVYTASVSETGSSTGAIKNYIQTAYNTFDPPPEFVGLVGDVGGTYSVPTYDECFGHDWGGCDGDFPYTQLDGNDFLPEIFIGRISVGSGSDLSTVIGKIINYEKATYMETMIDYYERAALVGDPSSSGASTIITNEYIENIMDSFEMEDVRSNYGDGGYASWMRNQLEEGMLYMNYRGYVGVSGFGNSDINAANNGHKLPFATFLTCGTGDFSGTSLSESFFRAGSVSNPKGAIASVGTATLSTHTMFNNIVSMGIYDGIFSQGIETAGASVAYGKLVMYNTYPSDPSAWVSAFTQWNNLIGDPVTYFWTDTPKEFQLIYDNIINVGTNFLDIKVLSDGIEISGAMVTILKGSDEIFENRYTDQSGNVIIPIGSNISTGAISLTVTKRNFKPYEATIDITNTGFIANYDPSLEIELNDETGNNNETANPGETVQVWIPIKNYGQFNIDEISGELFTDSDMVTISDGVSYYESHLNVGQTSYGDGFIVSVSPTAEEGEDLELRLRLLDGNETIVGIGVIPLHVSGTKFKVLEYELISGISLEPGVASDISITLKNEGSIAGVGLTGELNFYGSAIQIYDGDGLWDNIQPGESQVTSDWFTIRPSINVINGTVFNMKLWLQTDLGFNRELSFPVYVGEVSETDPLGPDEYGYYFYDSGDSNYELSPEYNWIEIDPSNGGSGTSLNLSDDGYGNFSNSIAHVELPFSFSFYGEEYESITVCSNGFISFGESELESFRNYPVPGAGGPSPMVAVFWDDLKTSGNGNVYTFADPENEFFIVEWSNMRTENYNSINTFQLILYNESAPPFEDGIMKFQYHTFNNTSSGDFSGWSPRHGGYCTVGLENKMGNIGLQYTYDNGYASAAMELSNGTAILVTTQPTISMTEVAIPVQLDENWNLIGLPVDVENGDYSLIYPDAIPNTLYSFDEGYQLVEQMEVGAGYWLRFNDSDFQLITGIRVDEMILELISGWNLISGISFDFSLNQIADPNDILVPNTLYGFGTDGYQGSDELSPGKGYWLRTYEAGTIFISTGGVARTAVESQISENTSWISINGQKLFFDSDISDEFSLQFSLPPKPPSGAFDVRFEGDTKLCEDECNIQIMTDRALEINYHLKNSEVWILVDDISGRSVILNPQSELLDFQFDPTSSMTLKRNNLTIPDSYTLFPPFPNPFNPETTLKFSLPGEKQFVTLDIINIRGQYIKSLISGEMTRGIYTFDWDGKDINNQFVGTGIYFGVLSSNSMIEIQKMILLK